MAKRPPARAADPLRPRVCDAGPPLQADGAPHGQAGGKDRACALRLSNMLCILTPGWRGEAQVMQMDPAGFAISAGSACKPVMNSAVPVWYDGLRSPRRLAWAVRSAREVRWTF